MNKNTSTAILVAGMHRSGTSALTGALKLLGISLGEHLLAPGEDNPKGYWEHQGAVEIHERLLAALGRRWDDVRPLPAGWLDSEAARVALAEIDDMIGREFAELPVWAVKDPRICRFLPLWLETLGRRCIRPVVLFAVRQPSEVAASIAARNRWSAPVSEILWLRHVLEAEAASRLVSRTVVVYDDLLANPAGTVSGALSRLGVAIGDSSLAEQGALAAFVDSADRHHRHAENQEDLSPMARIASSAYAILAEIAHGAEAWPALQQCSVHLEAQWQQCGATIEAVAEMAHRFSVNETAARVEAAHLASDLSAQIRWSEEAVEIRAALQANHDELLKRAEALTLDHQRLSADLERESEEAGRLRRELSLASARAAQAEGEASRFQGEAERAGVELSLLAARFAKADSDLAVARDQLTQLGQDLSRSENRAAQMQSELAMAHAEATRLGEQLSLSQAEASAHAARIEQMLHSRSWKVTRPLRALGAVLLPRARR
jgi:hypothetical protein